MIFDETTVISKLKQHQSLEPWVIEARERNNTYSALVTGRDFTELLLKKIEGIESNSKAKARRKYSKDIRDLFTRVFKKRIDVFEASGGSEEIMITSDQLKEEFISFISKFKGGKSISQYLSENYFKMMDTDPNGVLFMEYTTGEKRDIYPTYKSIQKIRTYESDGQKCEFIIFECENIKLQNGDIYKEWRIVDDKTDWRIKEIAGVHIIDRAKTFQHPFQEVPAIILSDEEEFCSKLRCSMVTPIEMLAYDLARDKSVLTIYKMQKGFPTHWKLQSRRKIEVGNERNGVQDSSVNENGGYTGTDDSENKADVTDVVMVPIPREQDGNYLPNIAGYISPDIETWKQYKEDLADFEKLIEHTIWGTHEEKDDAGNETATGRYIDVQPITNELNRLATRVEWVQNKLAAYVWAFVAPAMYKVDESVYHKSYGRRFIIEGPDVLLERYEASQKAGANSTIMDKLLEEYVLSKYKSDPIMQEEMFKKIKLEPYIHWSVEVVSLSFGQGEAFDKILFNEFWKTADKKLDLEQLQTQFNTYKDGNSSRRPVPVKPGERGV